MVQDQHTAAPPTSRRPESRNRKHSNTTLNQAKASSKQGSSGTTKSGTELHSGSFPSADDGAPFHGAEKAVAHTHARTSSDTTRARQSKAPVEHGPRRDSRSGYHRSDRRRNHRTGGRGGRGGAFSLLLGYPSICPSSCSSCPSCSRPRRRRGFHLLRGERLRS